MTIDKTGSLYCGITLNWDYENRTLDISMTGYVEKQLSNTTIPNQQTTTLPMGTKSKKVQHLNRKTPP
jgi:hypothetical protein